MSFPHQFRGIARDEYPVYLNQVLTMDLETEGLSHDEGETFFRLIDRHGFHGCPIWPWDVCTHCGAILLSTQEEDVVVVLGGQDDCLVAAPPAGHAQ